MNAMSKAKRKIRPPKPPKPPNEPIKTFIVISLAIVVFVWSLFGFIDTTDSYIIWIFVSLFDYWSMSNNDEKSVLYGMKPIYWALIALGSGITYIIVYCIELYCLLFGRWWED